MQFITTSFSKSKNQFYGESMMSKIQVLDCTLRDGGYCNNCRFGFDNEKKIVHGLVEANINIIECGFLMNTVEYDKDVTRFTSLDEVARIIPQNKEGCH